MVFVVVFALFSNFYKVRGRKGVGVRVSIWGAPPLETRRFPAAGAVVTRRRFSLRDRSPERRPGAFCSPPIPVAGWKVLSLAALASPSPSNNGGKRNRGTGQLAQTLFRVALPPGRLGPLPPMCRVGDLFNYLPGFAQIFGSAPYRNVLSATFFFSSFGFWRTRVCISHLEQQCA